MTELGDIFAELGISQYLNEFIEQGFDTWDTILDITESDFDALGVKLGHRRKLQRKIANSRGLSSDRALASPRITPSDDRLPDEQKTGGTKHDLKDGGTAAGAKRKYRRHPKPDENAPERPPSAYVLFSNKMREDLKGRNLSFTEIAKLVGENWQNLSPGEKEPYENQASSAKDRYAAELAEYKKTDSFKEHAQYLVEFKARQSNQQQVPDMEVAKRPKLEPSTSNTSNGTMSSGGSPHGGDAQPLRARCDSSASNASQWTHDSHGAVTVSKLNVGLGASSSQGSPNIPSPNVLPGYRESIYGGSQHSLPWREMQREDSSGLQKLPRLVSTLDRRPSPPSTSGIDGPNIPGPLQHPSRARQINSHPPPLLTHESTNRSTASSVSTSSSYFTPKTPMEPPLERLPIPSLYPQKSTGSYEPHLPPLIAPSLSPQNTIQISQLSPSAIPSFLEHPSSMAPMRGYNVTAPQSLSQGERSDHSARDFAPQHTIDDEAMDPFSALLKAGEIVNRNSRNYQGS